MIHIEPMEKVELKGATCLLCDKSFEDSPDAVKVKHVFFHPFCIVKLAIGLTELRAQMIQMISENGEDGKPN